MAQKSSKITESLQNFNYVLEKYKNDPVALAQLYKTMNYKQQNNLITKETEQISQEQMANFLNPGQNKQQYDDIMYYDNQKIREVVLRQNYLISKGFFQPREYFPSINIQSLDDPTYDEYIKKMLDTATSKPNNK